MRIIELKSKPASSRMKPAYSVLKIHNPLSGEFRIGFHSQFSIIQTGNFIFFANPHAHDHFKHHPDYVRYDKGEHTNNNDTDDLCSEAGITIG